MVEGKLGERKNPTQNGHCQRVKPSASGPAWRASRQRARRLKFAS
jgi:hypothetical protein